MWLLIFFAMKQRGGGAEVKMEVEVKVDLLDSVVLVKSTPLTDSINLAKSAALLESIA